MRNWRLATVVCMALLSGACGDEDSPTEFGENGNLHGTWVLEEEGRSTYVRVTTTQIRVYEQADTCFTRRDYDIAGIDGPMLTLVSDTITDTWQFSLQGESLVIDNGDESVTMVPTSTNLNALPMCASVILFDNVHAACVELPQITVGQVVNGLLEDGDADWDGTWYDVYSLQLTETSTVTISMTSPDDDIDTWLGVFPFSGGASSDDATADNDDIDYDGGNYNSRLTVELGPGCWVIVANSYDGDDAGEDGGIYTLEVSGDVPPPPPPDPDFPTEACTALPQLALESSVMDRIEEGDALWPSDDSYYDLYGLQIDATTEVTIEQRAGADDVIDSYMMLYNADATERLHESDDEGGDVDAQIVATLDPGCYIVVAGSYSDAPDEAGTYMVSAATGTVERELEHDVCVNLPLLAEGETVNGVLEAGDLLWADTWVDLYSLQITEPTNVRMTMLEDGSDIDTWLGIYDFQSVTRIIRNDDISGSDFNSQLETTLAPGCYVVFANSYEGDDEGEVGGAYTLNRTTF